jgi:hypothetical protein
MSEIYAAMAVGAPTMSSSQPALPANQAFVVQFRAPLAEGAQTYDGRVEHLVSGQEARFHSLEELLVFMISVLTDIQRPMDLE